MDMTSRAREDQAVSCLSGEQNRSGTANGTAFHRRINPCTLAGFGAIILWSTTVALARDLSLRAGPVTGAALVYCISGIIGIGILMLKPSSRSTWTREGNVKRAMCGALFVAYMISLYLGVGYAADSLQAIQVGLVNYLWPALLAILSIVVLGSVPGIMFVPGIALALSGIFLVVAAQYGITPASFAASIADNPRAFALGFTAAVTWALYSTLVRRWSDHMSNAVFLFLPATALALLAIRLTVHETSIWTVRPVIEVTVLGIITVLSYYLWDCAMRKGDIALVNAASYAIPMISTLISCLYLGVTPSGGLWTGALLIVCGSALSRNAIRHRQD